MSEDFEWDCSFTWRIENFLSSSYKFNQTLESPAFRVKSISGRKWSIKLRPAGEKEDATDAACRLVQLPEADSDKECYVDFKIDMMNVKNESLKTKICTNKVFGREYDSWGWSSFIEIDQVVAELKKCFDDTLIIRCFIKNRETKIFVEKDARSRMNAEKYFVEWNINVLPNCMFISGRHFFCLEENLYKINLLENGDDLEINICKLTQTLSRSRAMTGKITLLDIKGNEIHSKSEAYTYDSKIVKEVWKFPSLITRKQLRDSTAKYVIDGKIIFLCEFFVCKEIGTSTVTETSCETVSNIEGFLDLSNDFRSLLLNKSNSDVKLRTFNGEEWQAHRSVLAARSPVFFAMFNQGMVEKRTGTVDMKDVEGNTLEFFLKFLYTGVLEDMDWEEATKLLVVAEKYEVPVLKEKCALFLKNKLSVENLRQILVLADMVHHEVLKATSLDFVTKHGAKIFSSPDCSDWIRDHPQLTAEMLALAFSG